MSTNRVTVPTAWQSKIIELAWVDPRELKANSKNFRTHPTEQADALVGSVEDVGWIDLIKVNRNSGNIVDGHLRVEQAIANGQALVPVVWLDLTEEEESKALLYLDPIAAMAQTDEQKINELIQSVISSPINQQVTDFLEELQAEYIRGGRTVKRARENNQAEVTSSYPAFVPAGRVFRCQSGS